jgi:regulator of ribonuclease activity A
MPHHTADICDAHPDETRIVAPIFRDFGGQPVFAGPVATVKVHEDNVLVRQALEEPGEGRVLVVDGGGSTACALFGGNLAWLGAENGWAGIIIHGCVRDVHELREATLGVKAIATHPKKSGKKGNGERGVPVHIGGVDLRQGDYVYADEDGIVVCARAVA